MSEKEFAQICKLDDIAEQSGGFVDNTNTSDSGIHYDYRAIIAYCKTHNMEPIDMTIREMQQFVIA